MTGDRLFGHQLSIRRKSPSQKARSLVGLSDKVDFRVMKPEKRTGTATPASLRCAGKSLDFDPSVSPDSRRRIRHRRAEQTPASSLPGRQNQPPGMIYLNTGPLRITQSAFALSWRTLMFPEFREKITRLKAEDPHFAKLFHSHNDLDQEIKNMEAGITPASHDTIETLKKQKLQLKDDLYEILNKKDGCCGRCGG
jgi:uncharacterized protein YdcH (DUF465 family)